MPDKCDECDGYKPTGDNQHLLHGRNSWFHSEAKVVKPNLGILGGAPARISKRPTSTGIANKQLLQLLAVDPRNAEALMRLHEDHEVEIRMAASRWFERDRELARKAVNSILAAIGQQAGSYDPQSMDVAEWIRNLANAEARRLREALDSAAAGRPRAARPS